ncbi:hypothetical protein CO051_02155 [Candidatus Roizmanbacteria bacterium CG_4_9_14_0_2_um_filter_39_13]|uniref:Glycosyltransferase RgtA/B/C/D-like domain-containing protein n=1 Tax=Candidatus Roizmanbacteria bacterium CG_4_9_14_0_2_um_filter_39_13 TaxID=1974839 RepID=A0A2M8F1A1_9BACT|nr:MAG: hypothetical protein COY15_05980 [Candidatus Roizmanbacteria bacterium CG_4_10_14_0_2_um_filter_39_12]PJC33064.1 MAG: hypothetical protein CO051_02155 [Candidatus Roizmanbacteria bacterium CG_4_9_14_0_2_um_filter_39_13]
MSNILKIIKKHRYSILIFFGLLLLCISRFILLERSARFIWDESSDLVRMHEIFTNRRLTLVGPMDLTGTKIFGSLSYYMLMPFALLYQFDPIGPVIGTAFYSVVTALIFVCILSKKYHWKYPIAFVFITFVFPLVQSGRWAWNPHYIPLWSIVSLAIILWKYDSPSWKVWFLAGFFQMLGIHNHWYAVFSYIGFFVSIIIIGFNEKRKKIILYYFFGGFAAVLPFIIFDILRPPGLFISRLLYFSPLSPTSGGFTLAGIAQKLASNPWQFIHYFFQSTPAVFIFIPIFLLYLYLVIKKGTNGLKKLLLIPIIFQILGLSVISTDVSDYYFLAAIPAFILFITIPEKNRTLKRVQKVLLIVFFILSIYPSIHEITKNDWSTNISRTKHIAEIIAKNSSQYCNIYVVASKDSGVLGEKYRDLLSLKGVPILGPAEFGVSDCLFVISTSPLAVIRKDPAYEMDFMRKKEPIQTWNVEDGWKIYKFVSWN